MTDIVDRAKAALEGVTPEPWEIIGGGEYVTGVGICVAPDDCGVTSADARFIATARSLVPELIAEVDRLRARCCCHHQPITALPAATCNPCKLGRHIECERR